MKNLHVILMALLPFIACGRATFNSIQQRAEPKAPAIIESQDASVEMDRTVGDAADIPINTRSPDTVEKKPMSQETDNQKALNQCINQWQGQDLALELLKKARVVEVNQFQ